MSKTSVGLILMAFGIVIAVVAAAADMIGIGNYPGLNWVQMLGVAIGLVLAMSGVRLMSSDKTEKR